MEVGGLVVHRLKCTGCHRKIRRKSTADHIGVAETVHGDAIGAVGEAAAEVSGISEHRVNHQCLRVIVLAQREANRVLRQHRELPDNRLAQAVLHLIDDRLLKRDFSICRGDRQVAIGVQFEFLRPRKLKPDGLRICPRRNDEVVLQLPLVAVIDQIDARVDGGVLYPGKGWHAAVPFGRVVADEVVGCAGEPIQTGHLYSAIGPGQIHPDDIGPSRVCLPGPLRGSRLQPISAGPSGLRSRRIRFGERQHRRRFREE